MPAPILLYDGVCGLCNRFVQFILRHDRNATFRFASLQSPLATRILCRHAASATDLETVYAVLNFDPAIQEREVRPNEVLLSRSDAVQYVLTNLSAPYRAAAKLLSLIPRPLRDWAYRQIARHRYALFGHYETCPVPDPATRSRFLDL